MTRYTAREEDYVKAGEPDANARLIAAAPELLEALDQARALLATAREILRADNKNVQFTRAAFEALEMARAAIAKARGE